MPTVTLTDRAGFFQSSFEHGSTATVTVTPNRVESAEIGADGQHQLSSLGEHKHGKRGTGLEPAEVRQYVPGDTAQRIDWKVTARLSTPTSAILKQRRSYKHIYSWITASPCLQDQQKQRNTTSHEKLHCSILHMLAPQVNHWGSRS
ncbi:DUF58 domain-containing protein [Haladaptatus pallidirubidus]|uniref:DUF58 domain-containing protein n=1 Tax=Haladaptatus pallidirubidus TaxID=1008152 RepID=UPI0035EB8DFC